MRTVLGYVIIINFSHLHTKGHKKAKPVLGAPPKIYTYITYIHTNTNTYAQAKYNKHNVSTYKNTHKNNYNQNKRCFKFILKISMEIILHKKLNFREI